MQRWSIDDPLPVQVEHLGILATPTDHAVPIIPRGGWQKLETAISVLGAIPGSHQVRLSLACAYVRPLWTWALPIVTPPPRRFARPLCRALWRTSSSWWCFGRYWAQ
eukprot:2302965-Pyramimonas_sp.AAC.1